MGQVRIELDDAAHGELLRLAKIAHMTVSEAAKVALLRGLRALEQEAQARR